MTLPKVDFSFRQRFVAHEDIKITFTDESGETFYYEIRVASRGGTGSGERMIDALNNLFELSKSGTKIVAKGAVESPSRFTPKVA